MMDLSLHLLDLLENCANAGASEVLISLIEDAHTDTISVTVADNGVGMDPDVIKMATDPFFTTNRSKRTGLGLALAAQSARMTGGEIEIESKPGEGTRVSVKYRRSHVDRQPLGDPSASIVSFLAGHPDIRVFFEYKGPRGAFAFDSRSVPGASEQVMFLHKALTVLRTGLSNAGFRPDEGVINR